MVSATCPAKLHDISLLLITSISHSRVRSSLTMFPLPQSNIFHTPVRRSNPAQDTRAHSESDPGNSLASSISFYSHIFFLFIQAPMDILDEPDGPDNIFIPQNFPTIFAPIPTYYSPSQAPIMHPSAFMYNSVPDAPPHFPTYYPPSQPPVTHPSTLVYDFIPNTQPPFPAYYPPSQARITQPSTFTYNSVPSTPPPLIDHQLYVPSEQRIIDNTTVALALSFAGGELSARTNPSNTAWQLRCPDCAAWISTGIPSDTTLGDVDGHFASLIAHRNGRRCLAEKLKVAPDFGRGGAISTTEGQGHSSLQPPPRISSAPPDPLSPVKRNDVWYSTHAHEFDDAYTRYVLLTTLFSCLVAWCDSLLTEPVKFAYAIF